MDRPEPRSTGMSNLAALTEPAPAAGGFDFEQLYRSSRDDVYAYVATLLRDRAAAEDVTAAAFERAYRKASTYRAGRGTPRGWLFGIARNAALDELRRRKRLSSVEVEVQSDLDAPAPVESAEASAAPGDGAGGARSLDPRERELVALKFHGGLGNAELASVLGVSESNAGTLLHRTITKLEKGLR